MRSVIRWIERQELPVISEGEEGRGNTGVRGREGIDHLR